MAPARRSILTTQVTLRATFEQGTALEIGAADELALGPKTVVMMGIQTDYAMARARARLPEIAATVRRIAQSTS